MWFLCFDLSLRITFSRSIPIVACACISFLFMAGPYSIIWIHNMLFICSSIDGRLDGFLLGVLWIVLTWMFTYKFLYRHVCSFLLAGLMIVGSYDKLMINFLRNGQAVFQNGCTIIHTHQWCVRVPVSHQDCTLSVFFRIVIAEGERHPILIMETEKGQLSTETMALNVAGLIWHA